MKKTNLPSLHRRILLLNPEGLKSLSSSLELIMTVVNNYNHIQELENLEKLFQCYEWDYDKQYQTTVGTAMEIAKDVCSAHFSIAYERDTTEPDWRVNREYLLQNIVPQYFPEITQHNRNWKNLHIYKDLKYKELAS